MIELVTVEQTEIELTHILRWEDDGGYWLQRDVSIHTRRANETIQNET